MNTLSNTLQDIYTATSDKNVVINIYNRLGKIVPNLVVKTDYKYYNNYDVMAIGAPNNEPDTVHLIQLKSGESIKACAEYPVEYEIIEQQ